jgi:hypothetical protein
MIIAIMIVQKMKIKQKRKIIQTIQILMKLIMEYLNIFFLKNNKDNKTPLIIFTTLFGVSVLVNILLIVLLIRKNTDKNITTSIQRNYDNNNNSQYKFKI